MDQLHLRMDSLSPPQHFYAGEFRHSIDEKNRITVPSRWRRNEAEEFILLPEATHLFLLVMSPERSAWCGCGPRIRCVEAQRRQDRVCQRTVVAEKVVELLAPKPGSGGADGTCGGGGHTDGLVGSGADVPASGEDGDAVGHVK